MKLHVDITNKWNPGRGAVTLVITNGDPNNNKINVCVCVCVFRRPGSVITPGVVEALCGCMLARAELAEQEGQSPAHAERMVLVEFGHCLTRIVEAMFKDNTVDTSLGHASKPHQLSLFSA